MKTVDYPNEPFRLINRPLDMQTDAGSGASGEAVRKIRELFPRVREAHRGEGRKEGKRRYTVRSDVYESSLEHQ